jgi:SRSO17 transposase
MDIHASPAALPELDELVTTLQVRFRRPEGKAAWERYLTGLLTALPNKHCDTMAEAVPGTNAQRLQELLTNRQWDAEDLNRQRVHTMTAEVTVGQGVLIFDDTGFAKQGKHSVGVARQYSGTWGKVGNCQVAVTCCYSDLQASRPVAVRLYWPQAWTEEPERCRRARVPAAVTFQTKAQIALALLDQARAWGVPHRCVVVDADYGDNPTFLVGLEARRERYVVAVPRCQWRTIRWQQGAKGWLRKKFVAVRAWRVTAEGMLPIGWLLGERAARGQPEEHTYYGSNLPASTPVEELVAYAHRRHAIEQFHEEAKGERGWDHYQGRLWPGFHRHAVTVMLAYSFLVWLELRQRRMVRRRGRPREPFAPSARPVAADAPRRPPGRRPMAPPPGGVVVGDHRSVHRTLLTAELTKYRLSENVSCTIMPPWRQAFHSIVP